MLYGAPKNLDKVWSHGVRESSMITMGSLFIPTAFALLGLAGQQTTPPATRFALSIAALFLYLIWLFAIQLTSRLMSDIEAELQQYIRGPLGYYARLQRQLYGERNGNHPFLWIRRNHWVIFLVPLFYAAAYLIFA